MRAAVARNTAVLLYLRDPKERLFGLLQSLDAAGVWIRGLDLAAFEDWLRQEARHEDAGLGLATAFYPMLRVERIELDTPMGPISSLAERFAREVGRTVVQAARRRRRRGGQRPR
jgi:hypothetical protein